MAATKGVTRMRLRALIVGAVVVAAGVVVGHGAVAVDTAFTQSCASGSSLDMSSVSATNDSNNVTYNVTFCSAFTPSNISRISIQYSFSDTGQSSVPVDACLTVERSDYTSSGLNGYVTNRCVGGTRAGEGSPDAAGGGLLGTASVTQPDSTHLQVQLPITTLRLAGLGGENSYGLRVVARDADSAAHLAALTPQDAIPEDANTFLTDQLGGSLVSLQTLSINNVTKALTTGSSTMKFTVKLSAVSSRTVTVDYSAAPGTAATPRDFTLAPGTLTFAAGEVTKTITVSVKHGPTGTHKFTVTLSDATNALIGTATGTGTIIDR